MKDDVTIGFRASTVPEAEGDTESCDYKSRDMLIGDMFARPVDVSKTAHLDVAPARRIVCLLYRCRYASKAQGSCPSSSKVDQYVLMRLPIPSPCPKTKRHPPVNELAINNPQRMCLRFRMYPTRR